MTPHGDKPRDFSLLIRGYQLAIKPELSQSVANEHTIVLHGIMLDGITLHGVMVVHTRFFPVPEDPLLLVACPNRSPSAFEASTVDGLEGDGEPRGVFEHGSKLGSNSADPHPQPFRLKLLLGGHIMRVAWLRHATPGDDAERRDASRQDEAGSRSTDVELGRGGRTGPRCSVDRPIRFAMDSHGGSVVTLKRVGCAKDPQKYSLSRFRVTRIECDLISRVSGFSVAPREDWHYERNGGVLSVYLVMIAVSDFRA